MKLLNEEQRGVARVKEEELSDFIKIVLMYPILMPGLEVLLPPGTRSIFVECMDRSFHDIPVDYDEYGNCLYEEREKLLEDDNFFFIDQSPDYIL